MPRISASPARQHAPDAPQTSGQILDVAERLAQTRGFNGFSYADIAAELGITKASLHYHYPAKSDLGRALIERYSKAFADALARIEESGAPPAQLERYAAIYADVLKAGRICLCGMLAAEYTTLPEGMQAAIRGFFDLNERWLARILAAGRRDGTLAFEGSEAEAARAITSALEGAMLLARPYGGAARFMSAAQRVLRGFAAEGKPRPAKKTAPKKKAPRK